MDEQIRELESIAQATRAKNGRMDSPSRDKASALLASIWTNPSIDFTPTLQFLEDFKAEAVASAIHSCWARMELTNRNLFQQWVPLPSTEKSYRRLSILVASLLDIDGATALHWLGLLIPSGRKSLSKESRQLLASALFGDKTLSFEALAHGGADSNEVLRIYMSLFEIATDPSLSVPAMTRSRLATAMLRYFSRPDGPRNNPAMADIRSKIFADMKKWPPSLREQIATLVQQSSSDSPAPPIPVKAEGRPAQSLEQGNSVAPVAPIQLEVDTLGAELARIQGEVRNRLSGIAHEVELLRRVQEALSNLAILARRLESERDAANDRLGTLKDALRTVESERDVARAELKRENHRVLQITTTLEQIRVEAENERKRLAQQIAANATGRIEEFKNKVGLTLSRLVVDLPHKDTQVSAELGRVLLLQFHQFLDALRQEGIHTIPVGGGTR